MRSLDRKQNIKRTVVQIFINVFLAIVCLTMVLPLLYMLLCSTKSNEELLMEPFGLPHGGWRQIAENFSSVFSGNVLVDGFEIKMFASFGDMLLNEVLIVGFALLFLLIAAVPMGYAMGRRKFFGKRGWMLFLLLMRTAPLFGYLMAFHFLAQLLGFTDNLPGIGIIYAAVSMPGAVILLSGFFANLPAAVEEAAEIDGAGEVKRFFSLIVPMSKNTIFAIVLINFMGYWNEYAIANLLITRMDFKTISVNLMMTASYQMSSYKAYSFALLVLSALPTLLFFTIFQRGIIKGNLTMGSLKE